MRQRYVDNKLLRCGYTTGSCAAAAAKAAALLLLTGEHHTSVSIDLPQGTALELAIDKARLQDGAATCAVRKDSGDDPDITNGVLVYATVRRAEMGIEIEGGQGIGRVTKPGLDQPVGAAAINSAPRRIIRQALEQAMVQCNYTGGLSTVISIPQGIELAAQTFNPRLGIVGGLSILGTSGIVEPMSEAALIDTIRAELALLAATGSTNLLLTPGNYGRDFCRDMLKLCPIEQLKCGNFIGDTLAAAVEAGFRRILLVGHVGKLVKLGIGLGNTHSRHGDGRLETILACALQAGAELNLLRQLATCISTDAALVLLREKGLLASTMEGLAQRIGFYLRNWLPPQVECGFICFSNAENLGILCQSENAATLADIWRND